MPTTPSKATTTDSRTKPSSAAPLDDAYDAVLEALRDLAVAPNHNGRKTSLMRLASLHAARTADELEAGIHRG